MPYAGQEGLYIPGYVQDRYGIKASFVTDAKFTWVETAFLQQQGVQPWSHLPVWIASRLRRTVSSWSSESWSTSEWMLARVVIAVIGVASVSVRTPYNVWP